MKLQVQFKAPGFADMDITIRAKGFIAAAVYWANENGSRTVLAIQRPGFLRNKSSPGIKQSDI